MFCCGTEKQQTTTLGNAGVSSLSQVMLRNRLTKIAAGGRGSNTVGSMQTTVSKTLNGWPYAARLDLREGVSRRIGKTLPSSDRRGGSNEAQGAVFGVADSSYFKASPSSVA